MKDFFRRHRERITNHHVAAKSRSDYAEIHTPFALIDEMQDKLPKEVWSNPDKTWLDNCAGLGNFPLVVCERLMDGLEEVIPDEEERYRHIMKNQIFMIEIQEPNCWEIIKMFDITGDIVLNLKCADALTFPYEHTEPEDWHISKADDFYGNMFNTDYTAFSRFI